MNAPLAEDELLLLAFRYVAGELSRAESEAFEACLADDAAAQQALADVVQLSAAVGPGSRGACSRDTIPTLLPAVAERNVRRRQIAAAALAGGTIACGLFLLTGGWTTPPADPGTAASDVTPRQARSMVALWNELQFEEPDRPSGDDQLSSLASDDETDAALVPDWMLAAVAGLGPGDLPANEADSRPGETPPELDEEVL